MQRFTVPLIAISISIPTIGCGGDEQTATSPGVDSGREEAATGTGGMTGGSGGTASGGSGTGGADDRDASASGGAPEAGGSANTGDSGVDASDAGMSLGDSAPDVNLGLDAGDARDSASATDAPPDTSASPADAGPDTSFASSDASPDAGGDANRADAASPAEDSGLGAPISANDFQWTWIPIEGMQCRDGSSTGIGVNLNSSSDKVLIALDGGGACFSPQTCPTVWESYGPTEFGSGPGQGIYNRGAAGNPVSDWNYFYIPHCTGDAYAGDNPGGNPGIGPQQFVGYKNVEAALRRIIPTVAASQVLLVGISAGGSGALANYDTTATLYGDVPVVLLDDSGPPLSGTYIGPCLQNYWRSLWGFDNTFLAACGASCPNSSDYIFDLSAFLANKYPNRPMGFVASLEDTELRAFYGIGQTNCQVPDSGLPLLAPGLLPAGLTEFRTTATNTSNQIGTYYIASIEHSWLSRDAMYGVTVPTEAGTVKLSDWIADLVAGNASHAGP